MAEKKETIWLEVTRGLAGKFGYLEAEEQAREAGRVNAQKRFFPALGFTRAGRKEGGCARGDPGDWASRGHSRTHTAA